MDTPKGLSIKLRAGGELMGAGRGRRTFTQEFKEDAVRLVTDLVVSAISVAKEGFFSVAGTARAAC